MDRIKPFDDDDMNNFAFEKADADERSDEDLLSEWSIEGAEGAEDSVGPEQEKEEEGD